MQPKVPWYENPAFFVTILGMFLPSISAKLGVQLDATKIASMVAVAVTFIVSHHITSAKALVSAVEDVALAQVTAPATPPQQTPAPKVSP